MTADLVYTVTFGRGDGSEEMDWSIELTPEEEEIYSACIEEGEDLDEALADALGRAYDEILEQEKENMEEMGEEWSDGYSLDVHFVS